MQAPAEPLEDLDPQPHVVRGLGQRREEDVAPCAEALLVRADPAEPDQRERAALAVRRFGDDLLEQRAGVPDLAGLEVPLGGLDAAAPPRVAAACRRQPASLLQQLGGGVRRAARRGSPGRLVAARPRPPRPARLRPGRDAGPVPRGRRAPRRGARASARRSAGRESSWYATVASRGCANASRSPSRSSTPAATASAAAGGSPRWASAASTTADRGPGERRCDLRGRRARRRVAARADRARAPAGLPGSAAPRRDRAVRRARPAPGRSRARRRGCPRLRGARARRVRRESGAPRSVRSRSSSSPASRSPRASRSKRAAGRARSRLERYVGARAPADAEESDALVLPDAAPRTRGRSRTAGRATGRRRSPAASARRPPASAQQPEQAQADGALERLLSLRLGPQQAPPPAPAAAEPAGRPWRHRAPRPADRRARRRRVASRARPGGSAGRGGRGPTDETRPLTPERRLADPDLAFQQQRNRAGGDRPEELLDAIELGVAAYERARLRCVRHAPPQGGESYACTASRRRQRTRTAYLRVLDSSTWPRTVKWTSAVRVAVPFGTSAALPRRTARSSRRSASRAPSGSASGLHRAAA